MSIRPSPRDQFVFLALHKIRSKLILIGLTMLCSVPAWPGVESGPAFTPSSIAYVGARYRYAPFASLVADRRFFYEIRNKPSWATFDPGTGELQGIPGPEHAGRSPPVEIVQVSLGSRVVVAGPFSIEIQKLVIRPAASSQRTSGTSADGSLQIHGSFPPNARVGVAYEASISSLMHGVDVYMYAIRNKPSWATFDARTGRLRGTPAPADVGTFTDVGISLVGRNQVAELPPFSITVFPALKVGMGAGVAKMSWWPPVRNADGSELRDLAGYVLYWGVSPGALRPITVVNDARAVSQVLYGLPPGPNYFTLSAVDQDGSHSELGPIVFKYF
jgi:hypothetical protein